MYLGRRSVVAVALVAIASVSGGFAARASALAPQPPLAVAAAGTGSTYYTEDQMPTREASIRAKARAAAQADASSAAVDTALTLHSRPLATKKIYLDFDGFTLASGTDWIGQGIPADTYGGFSIDGAGSPGFTQDELDYITEVWTIVAEKYSPFDVDVTTATQDGAALTRATSGDSAFGTHVVFTDDQSARVPGCDVDGCAGVAFIGTFDNVETTVEDSEPAWVYTTLNFSSPGDPQPDFQQTAGMAANTAAHEIGHTLGLDHDTTTGNPNGYYGGHDNWSPIMGSSNRAIQQFNNGGYANALTADLQDDPTTGNLNTDDFDVMDKTGLDYRLDDEGGALGAQESYAVDGVITTAADSDTFTVDRSSCTGDLGVDATGIGLGQTLDIKVTISGPGVASAPFDPTSGAIGGTPNLPTGMDVVDATITDADPGTWTVKVEGVGDATKSIPDYGSVGQYHLTITGCSGIPVTPPGAPTNVNATHNPRTTTAALTWTAPADTGSAPLQGYTITVTGKSPFNVGPGITSTTLTGLNPGSSYTVGVAAFSSAGSSSATTDSLITQTYAPTTAPVVSTVVRGTSVDASWTVPANPGHATLDSWDVRYFKSGVEMYLEPQLPAATLDWTRNGLAAGTWTIRVTPNYTAADTSDIKSGTSPSFSIRTVPGAPKIGTPSSGATGGAVNAVARWAAPTSTGNSAITGYRVIAYKSTISGNVISATISKLLPATARSYTFPLPAGRYKFRVVAYNAIGRSPYSLYSALVYAR